MFAIGFVVALVAAFTDRYLEHAKYRTHDYIGRVIAAGCFIGGCLLMTVSVAIVAWKYLP